MKNKKIFAVIYRGYVLPGREEEYEQCWGTIAEYFVGHRGALGSCLHRTEDGEYLAYSRWPDRGTRDASWGDESEGDGLSDEIKGVIEQLKACIDESQPRDEICMEVVEDLLDAREAG